MAGLGRKIFTRERATVSDVNGYLMDQTVMRFASASARSAAIAAPSEGMTTYRDDTNTVEVYNGTRWSPVDAELITNLAGRPVAATVGAGKVIRSLDRPAVTFVSDGTRWLQSGLQGGSVTGAPANSVVLEYTDTVVATVGGGNGSFSFDMATTFSALPLFATLNVGGGDFSVKAVPLANSHTASKLFGYVLQANGSVVPNGTPVRINYTVRGYIT